MKTVRLAKLHLSSTGSKSSTKTIQVLRSNSKSEHCTVENALPEYQAGLYHLVVEDGYAQQTQDSLLIGPRLTGISR